MRERKHNSLRRRMLGIGDQLIDQLNREAGYRKHPNPNADIIISWCECHFRIERLADEYVAAIAAYRESMLDKIPKKRAPCPEQTGMLVMSANQGIQGD